MKKITRDDINIRVIAEDEDISIKQAAKTVARILRNPSEKS